jgi:competence protein ComEC
MAAAGLAGMAHGGIDGARALRDCRWDIADGASTWAGWVRTVEAPRRFQLSVTEGECHRTLRVNAALPAGVAEGDGLRLRGRWFGRAAAAPGLDPLRAGSLSATDVEVVEIEGGGPWRRAARMRAAGVARVERRFLREAALVKALVFARRDGLDPELREAFTSTGTAHLLAISGFHVGVLAAGVIALVGRIAPPRRAYAAGAVGAWLYVAMLGLPDAATRAALLLTLAGVGRWMGRPVAVAGAVGTALGLLVLVDPSVAGRIGAQLSFAGALGLAVFTRPWTEAAVGWWRRRTGEAPGPRSRLVVEAVVATLAATLTTFPFVAWHFERVSTVALPASLGATPLVALALPAVVVALALDALGLGPLAGIAAAGAEGLLALARRWVEVWAAVPGASVAVARGDAVALTLAVLVAVAVLPRLGRVGLSARAAVVGAALAAVMAAWPVSRQFMRNGALEVHLFDVGQGDAIGVRTPRGRWILVDAGPPSGHMLVRELRREGARSLALLVVSHPDADHAGGAPAVLTGLDVDAVAGPGTLRASGPWREALSRAVADGVAWRVLSRGQRFELDGVPVRVLHPPVGEGRPRDANDASLVLEVSWAGVNILLTGDVSADVERALRSDLGAVDVLKVAHHGSATSTDATFLEGLDPDVALISVGRGNRYGHPDAGVIERLESAGADLWRTDRHGSVRVRVDRSGRVRVDAEREAGR